MKVLNNILSQKAFAEANRYIPGGVNSPIRAWKQLGASPFFVQKANDAFLWDIDGNKYTDYCLSWGVFILGHRNPKVIKRVKHALKKGTSFGAPTQEETELARLICNRIPSIEKVRLVNSGTEAVMTAIRLARAYTGKNIIVKFDGCYHGHSDALLVNAGSGVGSLPQASSKGIPDDTVRHTISLPFNDVDQITHFFEQQGQNVAAIILEIVPGNMGVIIPQSNFLERIQQLSEQYKCLIIADEVITGFRHRLVTAQQEYAFKTDLTTLGKIIGGGFPIGAVGGRKEIMDLLAPVGPVYQAGTLSGNPIAVNAGFATLSLLAQPRILKKIHDNAAYFSKNMSLLADKYQFRFHSSGTMFSIFLTPEKVENFLSVAQISDNLFADFHHQLRDLNVYLAPSKFEANFISLAHNQKILDDTLNKIEYTIKKVYSHGKHN
ncbi:MAG: glutamate-1-semialdehyde 2,1-aminomutase [Bacteroidales bacterium]